MGSDIMSIDAFVIIWGLIWVLSTYIICKLAIKYPDVWPDETVVFAPLFCGFWFFTIPIIVLIYLIEKICEFVEYIKSK